MKYEIVEMDGILRQTLDKLAYLTNLNDLANLRNKSEQAQREEITKIDRVQFGRIVEHFGDDTFRQ